MRTLGALLLTLQLASVALCDASYTFRLTSLFQPDRVADFHALLKAHHPGITAESVDFDTSLVTLRIDSAANPSLQKARNPEQVRTQLNAMLRNSSKGVFELLALSESHCRQTGWRSICHGQLQGWTHPHTVRSPQNFPRNHRSGARTGPHHDPPSDRPSTCRSRARDADCPREQRGNKSG